MCKESMLCLFEKLEKQVELLELKQKIESLEKRVQLLEDAHGNANIARGLYNKYQAQLKKGS